MCPPPGSSNVVRVKIKIDNAKKDFEGKLIENIVFSPFV
jgi:hypothetical protein